MTGGLGDLKTGGLDDLETRGMGDWRTGRLVLFGQCTKGKVKKKHKTSDIV